jgi:hypothetical protein
VGDFIDGVCHKLGRTYARFSGKSTSLTEQESFEKALSNLSPADKRAIILEAYYDFLAQKRTWIPDVTLLPFAKSTIAQALLEKEDELSEIEIVDDKHLRQIEEQFEAIGAVRIALVSYSEIDAEDISAVNFFNQLIRQDRSIPFEREPEFSKLLWKYNRKGMLNSELKSLVKDEFEPKPSLVPDDPEEKTFGYHDADEDDLASFRHTSEFEFRVRDIDGGFTNQEFEEIIKVVTDWSEDNEIPCRLTKNEIGFDAEIKHLSIDGRGIGTTLFLTLAKSVFKRIGKSVSYSLKTGVPKVEGRRPRRAGQIDPPKKVTPQ